MAKGSEAQRTSTTGFDPVKNGFGKETTDQLQELLAMHSSRITRENILTTAKLEYNATQSDYNDGFFVGGKNQDDGGDESSNVQVRVAVLLLGLSKELRVIRFKLVPSKMKEPVFWAAVFDILGLTNNEDKQRQKSSSTAATAQEAPSSSRIHRSSSVPTSAADTMSVDQLLVVLQQKDEIIAELTRELEQFKKNQHHQNGSSSSKGSSPVTFCSQCGRGGGDDPSRKHRGKWIMNQDSIDFLAMDEEIKTNLRNEKAKRLAEVKNQMKFILDTDDISSSVGEWACCKAKSYDANGCL